jgi:hypothetical protein
VQGLTVGDVARFLAQTMGWEPAASLVTALREQTAGNPFFLREMVHVLLTEGHLARATGTPVWPRTLPLRIRETMRQRLARLPEPCVRLLTAAAVIGHEFRLDVLRHVYGEETEVTRTAVLTALHDAVVARTCRRAERLGYLFVIRSRETLYEDLSLAESSRWHRQVVDPGHQGVWRVSPGALADHAEAANRQEISVVVRTPGCRPRGEGLPRL